jgi:hypothetical protein
MYQFLEDCGSVSFVGPNPKGSPDRCATGQLLMASGAKPTARVGQARGSRRVRLFAACATTSSTSHECRAHAPGQELCAVGALPG